MRALKLTYILPLVISLTTAPEGCVSLGLLSQSIVIVARVLLRLVTKARSRISGFASSNTSRASVGWAATTRAPRCESVWRARLRNAYWL
jgi:hypothetical protein